MNELISDEVAKKIIEEANKACSKCKELICEECEYRFWRTDEQEAAEIINDGTYSAGEEAQ